MLQRKLDLEDIQYWIDSITKADNLDQKNFDIVESLPGLFTIKYKDDEDDLIVILHHFPPNIVFPLNLG